MPLLTPGLRANLAMTVTDADTAERVGSGDVPVLATPRLIAWMEAATVAAVAGTLDSATTTVGVRVEVDHLAPTAVGRTVRVEARLVAVDGRRLGFVVEATDDAGTVAGKGTIRRAVVDREHFLGRLSAAH